MAYVGYIIITVINSTNKVNCTRTRATLAFLLVRMLVTSQCFVCTVTREIQVGSQRRSWFMVMLVADGPYSDGQRIAASKSSVQRHCFSAVVRFAAVLVDVRRGGVDVGWCHRRPHTRQPLRRPRSHLRLHLLHPHQPSSYRIINSLPHHQPSPSSSTLSHIIHPLLHPHQPSRWSWRRRTLDSQEAVAGRWRRCISRRIDSCLPLQEVLAAPCRHTADQSARFVRTRVRTTTRTRLRSDVILTAHETMQFRSMVKLLDIAETL